MRRLAVAALVARLSMSMWSVVLFLLVADRQDVSSAAMTLAAFSVGQALTAPVRGRWIDRWGARPVLLWTTTLHLPLVVILVVAIEYAALPAYLAVALLSGASMPPVAATIRGLWISLTEPGNGRHTAMSLDAVLLETAFMAGPAAAAVLATWADPVYALIPVLASLALAAVLVTQSQPTKQQTLTRKVRGWGPIRVKPFRTTLVLALVPTVAIAALEVLLLTISHTDGYEWAGGLLIAGLAAGSLVGGLLFGAYGSGRTPEEWLPIVLGVMAATIPLVLIGQAAPWTFFILAPLLGATTAPCLATVFSLSASVAPSEQRTEAQSWVNTILALGFALGALIVAPFSQHIEVAAGLLVAIVAIGAFAARHLGRTLPTSHSGS